MVRRAGEPYVDHEPQTRRPKDPNAMTPIAAYYVMVATDNERELRRPKYRTPAPKPSRLARIADALEGLVTLGRPSTTQPI
jgi:hypothetical protein